MSLLNKVIAAQDVAELSSALNHLAIMGFDTTGKPRL